MRTNRLRTKAQKEALGHWILQRVTAVVLIPLSVWFIYSLMQLVGMDAAGASDFFQNPLNALLAAATITISFWHGALGLQVIVEDYVHNHTAEKIAHLLIKLFCYGLAAVCVYAVYTIHIG